MSKVKYAPLTDHIENEHHGFTFQTTRSGNIMMKAQSNDRARQLRQQNSQVNLINAAGHWRTLSVDQQAAWNLFASTYPQPSKRNALVFLTGYQLYLKRSQYCHLNYDVENGFILEPVMAELPALTIVPTIEQTQNVLDVTGPYIKQFGIIPAAGSWLLFKAVPMAVLSGQFYETIYMQLQVLESYIDGLFISLELSENMPEVVFSVYLSKPYSPSVKYSGTKTRYMGCFTSKTFLELTDTPATYAGESGKTVTVKADETGLEFTTPAAGGLTCETLAECPVIVTIETDISTIETAIALNDISSLPPVNFGINYNLFTFSDVRGAIRPGWRLPTNADFDNYIAANGGAGLAGGASKITGYTHWLTPNVGATNSAKFNASGPGFRGDNGAQFKFKDTCYLWTSSVSGIKRYTVGLSYNDDNMATLATWSESGKGGFSVRLVKIDSSTVTPYIDNNGRIYRTKKIGNLVWMCDNLSELKFNDGTAIPVITLPATWAGLSTAGLWWPNGDINLV